MYGVGVTVTHQLPPKSQSLFNNILLIFIKVDMLSCTVKRADKFIFGHLP